MNSTGVSDDIGMRARNIIDESRRTNWWMMVPMKTPEKRLGVRAAFSVIEYPYQRSAFARRSFLSSILPVAAGLARVPRVSVRHDFFFSQNDNVNVLNGKAG